MLPAPNNTRPQFSLFGLFAFTSLFCVVFGLLAALGAPPLQALFGFALFGGIAGGLAAVIELFAQIFGLRRRNF